MNIERTDEGATLATVVVESQQLETSITGSTQVALDIVFISKHLQAATGIQELLGLRGHAIVAQ